MLGKFKLKTILLGLVVTGICLPAIIILFTLTNQYKRRMLQDYTSYVDNELARIASSVDSYLQAKVMSFSEAVLYDQTLNELLNQPMQYTENSEEQKSEYLVREYMLNHHLKEMAYYGIGDIQLAVLINRENQCFNLKYPIHLVTVQNSFLNKIVTEQMNQSLRFNWYPLMEDPFVPTDVDVQIREKFVIPVTRDIISPLSQKYYGKQVFLISEKNLYLLYSVSELAQSSRISVIDTKGNIISCSDINVLQDENRPLLADVGVDESQQLYTTKMKIETNGWSIFCEASLAHIYAAMHQKVVQNAIGIVCLLLIICVVVIWAANRITAPFYTLMSSMKRASHKDFSLKIKEQGTQDVLYLIRDYNSLLEDIEEMIYHEYELNRQKQQAEMDALVTQINPHFLYNTLESIVWQARSAGAPKVADMAHYLGELFNLAVNKGKPMMSIEDELRHVQMYVNLQNMRYDNRICLHISWDDEKLLHKETLKLILQPIVENSILHGLSGREVPITIYIHVEADEDKICFYVEDNGNGMGPKQLENLDKKLKDSAIAYDIRRAERVKHNGNGIGIVNIHQRLRLDYGNQYGVKIHSVLGKGTCTEICIPNRDKKEYS